MAKIEVRYARDTFSTFGKYWGIFLFPLLPIWLLFRDDGDAGYLDLDGKKIARLKYKKSRHPQIITVPSGEHILTYRKKSKLAMGWNSLMMNSSDGSFASTISSAVIANNTKGDTSSYKINFKPDTKIVLFVEGGINKGHTILENECVL